MHTQHTQTHAHAMQHTEAHMQTCTYNMHRHAYTCTAITLDTYGQGVGKERNIFSQESQGVGSILNLSKIGEFKVYFH